MRVPFNPSHSATLYPFVIASLLSMLAASTAYADDTPQMAEVLNKLHATNQKEIRLGKEAQKKAKSKNVANFGKLLVKDHSAADKKVVELAKSKKVELNAAADTALTDDMTAMAKGSEFDKHFAQMMLDDHTKDISELTDARDHTTDPDLKKLINDILPDLQKHKVTAQKILDGAK
jgi:putative membrane protein